MKNETGNLVISIIATIGIYLWNNASVFIVYLVLNVIDTLTGILKAKKKHVENSRKGLQGVLRKLGCWILIFVSFLVSIAFVDIGRKLSLNLNIMLCLGWYVLGTMILNELRSIIENLIQLHVFIPKILTKGLQELQDHFK